MITVCLVTNELYPITHGGCGTLIYNSVYSLLEANFRVLILADINKDKLKSFESKNILNFPNLDNLEIYCVSTLLKPAPNEEVPEHEGLRQSWRFYKALQQLLKIATISINIIEIPDYSGFGYYTLLNKEELPKNIRVYIRFHLTMEWIDDSSPCLAPVGERRILTYGLERWCLQQADCVLAPSINIAEKIRKSYIAKQILISTPSLSGLKIVNRQYSPKKFRILFYARLASQKGAELFVNAAVELMKSAGDLDKNICFTVAGPDQRGGLGGVSMLSYLQRMIPDVYRAAFEFTGNLDRQALDLLLPTVLFAVFPTRSETYCYSARELSITGVPLICSDIPAFKDLVDEGFAISVDLNVKSWALAISQHYKKYYNNKSTDKYWVSSNTLINAYNLDTPLVNSIIRPVNEDIFVLFFVFSTQLKAINDIPLYDALNNSSFKYKLIIAYEDENGSFFLRNKRWVLSSSIPDKFNIVCFLDSSDLLSPDYINWAIRKLKSDSEIVIVTCACKSNSGNKNSKIPWHVVPTLLPFKEPTILRRAFLRIDEETKRLCFDAFVLELHEISAIWNLMQKPKVTWVHTEKWSTKVVTNYHENNVIDINQSVAALLIKSEDSNMPLLNATVNHLLINSYKIINIPDMIKQGKTPEFGGYKLNIPGIYKLLVLRLNERIKSKLYSIIKIYFNKY